MTAPLRLIVSTFTLVLVACYSHIWPSYALEVPLEGSGSTPTEVGEFIRNVLVRLGYRDAGKDGRDEVNGTLRVLHFENAKDIRVSAQIDLEDVVAVRLSYADESLKGQAQADFEALDHALLAKWPMTRHIP